jgi:hypothetical protein
MGSRPTLAFLCSLIGGITTLIIGLILVNSWFLLYSETGGASFTYWLLGDLFSFTAAEALALFIIGAICGVLIIVGAVLQFSGKKARVRIGSLLVVVASIIGAPSTYFGMIIGGFLSVVGAALGFGWKSSNEDVPGSGTVNNNLIIVILGLKAS